MHAPDCPTLRQSHRHYRRPTPARTLSPLKLPLATRPAAPRDQRFFFADFFFFFFVPNVGPSTTPYVTALLYKKKRKKKKKEREKRLDANLDTQLELADRIVIHLLLPALWRSRRTRPPATPSLGTSEFTGA